MFLTFVLFYLCFCAVYRLYLDSETSSEYCESLTQSHRSLNTPSILIIRRTLVENNYRKDPRRQHIWTEGNVVDIDVRMQEKCGRVKSKIIRNTRSQPNIYINQIEIKWHEKR